jgi:signal transduction histidine kinase
VHELEVHQVELQMQNQELIDAQMALTTARDRYASLFDLAPVGYLVLDRGGVIREANAAACTLLAQPRHGLLRHALLGFVALPDQPALARHLEEAGASAGRPSPIQVTLPGEPPRTVRLDTVGEPDPAVGGGTYRTAMIDVTAQVLGEQLLRAERAALERSRTALRELTHRLIAVEEDERRRLAADLHDDIGQRLHAVQMELALLERRPAKARPLPRLQSVHRHLDEVLRELEGIARNLHPKIVEDLGLRVALRAHAEDVARQAGLAVRFRERAVPAVIPRSAATCLYRVAQEALRNVRRHAAARAATVTLARVRGGLGLCVADTGRGFRRPDQTEQTHRTGRGLGLITMNERVNALAGRFRVRTNPGDGTHVHAWVPLA